MKRDPALRRFDALALEQALAEVNRLAAENDALRRELARAEQCAEGWREDALRLMEEACALGDRQPGITLHGALVTVPAPAEVRA